MALVTASAADALSPSRFALMVGTSGAMRVVVQQDKVQIPSGLWCYRVDPRRFILGGALSNGGTSSSGSPAPLRFRLTLKLSRRTVARRARTGFLDLLCGRTLSLLAARSSCSHSGHESRYQPTRYSASRPGRSRSSVRQIYALLTKQFPAPVGVVASGGALLQSQIWSQMMADSIGSPVVICREQEASGRGAALLAAERLHLIDNLETVPARLGQSYNPRPENTKLFDEMFNRQCRALWHFIRRPFP